MNTIATHIEQHDEKGMRIFVTQQKAKDVLTIVGSFPGGTTSLPRGKGIIATLTAELLDTGTKTKSKEQLRKILADKGISLSFSTGGARTSFSASALPEDIDTVLSLIVECVTTPRFEPEELRLVKARMLGELAEEKTDTRTRASIALSRALYEPAHPNYSETIEELEQSLKKVSIEDIRKHASTFGSDGLVVAVVGDIRAKATLAKVVKIFAKMPAGSGIVQVNEEGVRTKKIPETYIAIPDKANIDTFFATTVPFTYDDQRFLPLSLAVSMLAGRGLSTGHLMRTIRERDGLTYGIYGSMGGFDDATTGYWRIWGTFAPTVFKKALTAVKKEINVFLTQGVNEKKLALKKQEVAGGYQVALSTSSGLASMLHKIGKEGRKLSYLDEYPELVQAVTLAEVKKVLIFLAPESLALAAAGSFSA